MQLMFTRKTNCKAAVISEQKQEKSKTTPKKTTRLFICEKMKPVVPVLPEVLHTSVLLNNNQCFILGNKFMKNDKSLKYIYIQDIYHITQTFFHDLFNASMAIIISLAIISATFFYTSHQKLGKSYLFYTLQLCFLFSLQ